MGKFLKRYWMLVLVLPAVGGLLWPGYFSVHDALHPAWVFEMYQAVKSGQLPPRWAPNLSFGYGYPLFHFVYPLPYYLGALFYSLGASLSFSVELVTVLAVVASFVFMYYWMKELGTKKAALLAAVVYVYTPYRAVDIYVRGALGETLAFAFLPMLGWGITRLIKLKEGKRIGLLITSLGVAGLILSHNLTAYLGLLIFSLLTGVLMLVYKRGWASLAWVGGGVVLGLLLSAYFWLTALLDKRLMVDDSFFNFIDHNEFFP